MLTVEKLKAFGADTAEGVSRCVNNETFYLRMVGMALSDANFEKLENAVRAGVDHLISFKIEDAAAFSRATERGVIVTNPPYGERLLDRQQAEQIYRDFGAAFTRTGNWGLYLLSSHTEFERCFGKPADKKRKLYNGMIKCDLFMYYKSSREAQP